MPSRAKGWDGITPHDSFTSLKSKSKQDEFVARAAISGSDKRASKVYRPDIILAGTINNNNFDAITLFDGSL